MTNGQFFSRTNADKEVSVFNQRQHLIRQLFRLGCLGVDPREACVHFLKASKELQKLISYFCVFFRKAVTNEGLN